MQTEPQLRNTLDKLGIPALNTLQETAIPAIHQHPNVVLLAPTGSGKTLAFLLPILQRLKPEATGVQCLILSPTRELAIQIERVWQQMGTGFKVNTCYGGHAMQTEIRSLTQPPALLIGTPGRILEHITRRTVDLRRIHTLVLDEFDKCLSMGFEEQMTAIIKGFHFLEKRILVSATGKQKIPPFTGITNPKVLNFYKVPDQLPESLELKQVQAPEKDRDKTLFRLLCHLGNAPTLIFCNQRDTTERVRSFLAGMRIQCAGFHGGMDQPDRERILVRFRNGSIPFLVASDLAARGLDIPEVEHVIHYDLPQKEKDFVHRNGRTARMQATGTAYLLLSAGAPLPAYLSEAPPLLELPPSDQLQFPEPSPWVTLYISGGKKNKISKMDIVGFFTKKGHLDKSDIGKIEVLDFMAYAAVKQDVVQDLLEAIRSEKMKGKKYKIEVAR